MNICPYCGQENLKPYDQDYLVSCMNKNYLPHDLKLHDCGELARLKTICGKCQKKVISIEEQLGDRCYAATGDDFIDTLKEFTVNQKKKDAALELLNNELIKFPFDWHLHWLKARTLLVFDEDDEAKRSFYEYFFYKIYDDLVDVKLKIEHMTEQIKNQKIKKRDFMMSQEYREDGKIETYRFDELRYSIEGLTNIIKDDLNSIDFYTHQGDFEEKTDS